MIETRFILFFTYAATTLVADQTFKSSGTIEIAHDGSVTSTGTNITGFSDTAIYNLVPQHPLEISGRTYVITLDIDGTYTIDIP